MLFVIIYFIAINYLILTILAFRNCCKLEIAFKYQTRLSDFSDLKTLYPRFLYLELFISFIIVSASSPVMVRVSGTSGERIGVSPLTGKNVKPINNNAVGDHLLHCN